MPAPLFKVDSMARAADETEALYERAQTVGRGDELMATLRHIFRRLKQDPAQFGDPQIKTLLPGGMICHAIHDGLYVRFAVYENERVVLILSVRPYGHTWDI
jgi:hypothetical protein